MNARERRKHERELRHSAMAGKILNARELDDLLCVMDARAAKRRPPDRRHIYMVQPRFEPAILARTKCSTIRRRRKRTPAKLDIIQLRAWTGTPYRSRQRIIGEAVVQDATPIRLTPHRVHGVPKVPRRLGSTANFIARRDGFKDYAEMWAWFKQTYGDNLRSFDGELVSWDFFEP